MRFGASFLAMTLALASCSKKAGPDEAARQFFDLIAQGKAAAAYASTTFGFQTPQSENFFKTTLIEFGLDAGATATFAPADYSSDRRVARVAAEFKTASQQTVRLVVALLHEGGQWKVLSLKSPRHPVTGRVENPFSLIGHDPTFGDPTRAHSPPDAATVKALTHASLLAFNDAVQRKDFTTLFDECSLHWQDQLVTREGPAAIPGTMRRALTPKERDLGAARLQYAFRSFIDQQIDIGGIDGIEPVFDRPAWVNTEGLLTVSGYYPTRPYRVLFSLKLYYEVPVWRLFGLDVSVRKADAG
ncbi:MAG: hypothetical protein ABMA13_05775 [Chthoniobacteraceae bacterium]